MSKETRAPEKLLEYCSAGLSLKVDREKGIISGVKILGMESQNGRSYTAKCVTNAMPLYEQAAVFVDHSKGPDPRSYHDRIGRIESVRASEDGLYGDLHLNPKHSLAEQLFWDAENAPQHVGFSHDCMANVSRKDGRTIVESISSVKSVDLVAKPATTRGLFEDAEEVPEGQREFCVHGLSAVSDARQVLLGGEDTETKKARLAEILSTWQGELSGEPEGNKETSTMEWKEVTLEGLKENRKDLVEVLTGTDATSKLQAENKTLLEQLDSKEKELKESADKLSAIEAKEAEAAKKLAIAEELKASELDATNQIVVSPAFMSMLEAAADMDARKALIEDRKAMTKSLRETRKAPAASAPLSTISDGEATPARTREEFLGRI